MSNVNRKISNLFIHTRVVDYIQRNCIMQHQHHGYISDELFAWKLQGREFYTHKLICEALGSNVLEMRLSALVMVTQVIQAFCMKS